MGKRVFLPSKSDRFLVKECPNCGRPYLVSYADNGDDVAMYFFGAEAELRGGYVTKRGAERPCIACGQKATIE